MSGVVGTDCPEGARGFCKSVGMSTLETEGDLRAERCLLPGGWPGSSCLRRVVSWSLSGGN